MAEPITPAEIHAAELAALRDEVDQQRTRAEAAEADRLQVERMNQELQDEIQAMRKDRDAALLTLPAGCGSLADAASTAMQDLAAAHRVIGVMESTAELVAKQRADMETGLQGMRDRFDAAYRAMIRAKVALGTQADREQVADLINKAVAALTGSGQ